MIEIPSVTESDCLFIRLAVSEHNIFKRAWNALAFPTLRKPIISFWIYDKDNSLKRKIEEINAKFEPLGANWSAWTLKVKKIGFST